MLKLPLYLKATVILLMLFMLFTALYFLRPLLVPLSFAALLSILLVPVVERFQKWGISKSLSILFSILIMLLVLVGIIYLFTTEISAFIQDLPRLTSQADNKLLRIQSFIQDKTHMDPDAQIEWLRQHVSDWLLNSGSWVTGTIATTTSTIADIALLPFYIFFFLYYRQKFTIFLFKVTPTNKHYKLEKLIDEIQHIIQSYLQGIIIVICILAVLDVSDLMILGIEHAVFLGLLAALLNIIPYIGVIIGNLIATTVAFLTKDAVWYPVAVLASFWGIQMLENNLLTPRITGSKVKINPLVTFLALIIGGSLWGIAGMFLFIPFIGIVKVIFDNIPEMEPYGFLLGSDEGTEMNRVAADKLQFSLTRRRKNKKNNDEE